MYLEYLASRYISHDFLTWIMMTSLTTCIPLVPRFQNMYLDYLAPRYNSRDFSMFLLMMMTSLTAPSQKKSEPQLSHRSISLWSNPYKKWATWKTSKSEPQKWATKSLPFDFDLKISWPCLSSAAAILNDVWVIRSEKSEIRTFYIFSSFILF